MESTIVASEKSTHDIPVFEFDCGDIQKHENADRLGVYKIPDSDYTYVLNLADWENYRGTVAWIQPDSLVNWTLPEFLFLVPTTNSRYDKDSNSVKQGNYIRIKAKRLRGIVSYGLLIPLHSPVEDLDIHHYEAPVKGDTLSTGGQNVSPPKKRDFPKYDVDAFLKYGRRVFISAEPVWVYEKIHGCNGRMVYQDGQMYCGSRAFWKKEFDSGITLEELTEKIGDAEKALEIFNKKAVGTPSKNLWWKAMDSVPTLFLYCANNEGYCVYGEVYGQVQKGFNYGLPQNTVSFAAFDIMKPNGQFMDMPEFQDTCDKWQIPTCPLIAKDMPFNFEELVEMAASKKSQMPGATNVMEGIVVTPAKERWDEKLGRVKLKIINPEYLEKS